MTQILIVGTAVLATGPFAVTEEAITGPDCIFPVHTVEGWSIVDAEIPQGFTPGGYQWSNGLHLKPAAPPSEKEYSDAVQALLDQTAQARGYDDIKSACSYAGAPNPFQAEGAKLLEWRGNVWASCYATLAAVQGGATPPTILALLAGLPAYTP